MCVVPVPPYLPYFFACFFRPRHSATLWSLNVLNLASPAYTPRRGVQACTLDPRAGAPGPLGPSFGPPCSPCTPWTFCTLPLYPLYPVPPVPLNRGYRGYRVQGVQGGTVGAQITPLYPLYPVPPVPSLVTPVPCTPCTPESRFMV